MDYPLKKLEYDGSVMIEAFISFDIDVDTNLTAIDVIPLEGGVAE